ncbi:MAG: LysM peptidoglycan-binding domain-containing protein [Anaerolineae bacterium]|nr:LysM peptidoglycan-binding domain-containing protein [Anaerolineae bacterium]
MAVVVWATCLVPLLRARAGAIEVSPSAEAQTSLAQGAPDGASAGPWGPFALAPALQEDQLAYLWQVLDIYWANQDWPKALEIIGQIEAIDPNYRNVQERKYYAHVAYGYDLMTDGQCEVARAQFNLALALRPYGQEAQNGLQLLAQYCPATQTPPTVHTLTPTITPGPSATRTPTPSCFPVTQTITYTVKLGDTLLQLAKCFHTTPQQIMKANGMMSDVLRVGSVIYIPGPAEVPPGPSIHVVQPGETLYSIAQKHRTTVWAIMRINHLPSPAVYAYQVLYIPTLLQEGPFIHIVQPGQTLYTIAAMHEVPVEMIMLANNLKSYDIYVFQRLVIPPDGWTGWPPIAVWTSAGPGGPGGTHPGYPRTHRVQPGDTLYSIARRYGTTVPQLKAANGLTSSLIYVGMILRIPW